MTGELAILDRSGDTRIIWDSENPDEVENARATFNRLTKAGYWAYSVRGRGDKGEQIREFDPEAEKLILAPQMVGG